jgi:hypothetical protein
MLDDQKTAPPPDPAATGRHGKLSRRAFLLGTVAVSALLVSRPLAAAAVSSSAPSRETSGDEAFWDDGTGWV